MTIQQIIGEVRKTIGTAQLVHWNVSKKPGSYATHIALGDFYDGLADKLDEYVESYQGQFGIINGITIPSASVEIGWTWIKSFAEMLEKEKAICCVNSHLSNIVDEMKSMTYRTLYKLENLQ